MPLRILLEDRSPRSARCCSMNISEPLMIYGSSSLANKLAHK